MDETKFFERIDNLIATGRELTNSSVPIREYNPLQLNVAHYAECHQWNLSCRNLILSQFGTEHSFFNNFMIATEMWQIPLEGDAIQPLEYPQEVMAKAHSVLLHIKEEVELGLVADAKHLYEADLFSNLIEQAYELADKDYLVGAAVHGRLVIENYINDLCRIKKVELEDKDKLPQKLTKLRKKQVIDLPLERKIQASYDVGTYAVHGREEFNKYSKEQVIDILNNIRDNILIIK